MVAIIDELSYSVMLDQNSSLMQVVVGVRFRCSRVSPYQPGRYIQHGWPNSDLGSPDRLVLSQFIDEDE